MIRYVVLLIAPLIIGALIAVAVLLINGLRERRERTRRELYEARRLDRAPSSTDLAARSRNHIATPRRSRPQSASIINSLCFSVLPEHETMEDGLTRG